MNDLKSTRNNDDRDTSNTGTGQATERSSGGTAPIETWGLSLQYRNHRALEDVTLTVRPHRITALIGPSGCGKTSLLTCLNRMTDLVPGCCVTGSATCYGTDLLGPGLDVVSLRRRVGMIFQQPNPFPMSIRRNIEMPLREHGIRGRQQLDQIVEATLRDVGLWDEVGDRLETSALGLSGGQQQRLCIARAIALKPRILLMDEPCSSLDPLASAVVEELIQALRSRYTVMVVTHNLSQARRIADDVVVFWLRDGAGRLIEAGPASELFDSPRDPDAAAYLSGRRG